MSSADDSTCLVSEAATVQHLPGRRVSRGHVAMVAAIAVVLISAAGAMGLRWWSHPDLLESYVNSGSLGMAPQPLEESQVTFSVTYPDASPDAPTATFNATPVMTFDTNTARATATFSVCYQRDNARNVVIGSARGTGSRYCERLVPIVEGTTLQIPSPDAYVVATVTPQKPGRVEIAGADFDYSLGPSEWLLRGVEHLDMRIVLKRIY